MAKPHACAVCSQKEGIFLIKILFLMSKKKGELAISGHQFYSHVLCENTTGLTLLSPFYMLDTEIERSKLLIQTSNWTLTPLYHTVSKDEEARTHLETSIFFMF